MTYSGKVALITGGGSGMGRAAARTFAANGARVAIVDVDEAGMAQTRQGFDNIVPYPVDITDFDALARCVEEVEAALGPLDRVYNCAAIMPFGKLLEQDQVTIHRMTAINYGGLVNVAKTTLPGMVERGQGDFVSFASMAGITPGLMMGAYCATKAAAAMFTEVLYHENRDSGLRFACVCPPPVATPLLDQGRRTAWPKLMEGLEGKELSPQEVIDHIELCLDKGRFWVFPGKGTRMGYIMRRLFPERIWNYVHKLEGW